MHYIFTLYSLFFNPYTCFGLYKAIIRELVNSYNIYDNETGLNVIADKKNWM
jgi:hypothetical protein